MQRIMIAPPHEVLELIWAEAAAERRSPKNQIEHILIQHVRNRQKPVPAGVSND